MLSSCFCFSLPLVSSVVWISDVHVQIFYDECFSFIHYDLVLISYEDDDGNNVHLEMKTGRRADDAGSGSKSVQVREPLLPGAMLLRHQLRPCLPDRGLQRWALPRSPAPVHVPEERLLKRALS